MSTTLSEDIEAGPAEGQSLREWIRTLKKRHDLNADEILFQTSGSDPCWIGTQSHYEKADWAATYFYRMIEGREDDHIHTRGLHYWMISLDEEIPPPTDSPQRQWDVYHNDVNCYQELVTSLTCARVLGNIPLDAVVDESAAVTTIEGTGRMVKTTNPQSQWNDPYMSTDIVDFPPVDSLQHYSTTIRYEDFDEAVESTASEIARRVADSIQIYAENLRPYYIEVWSEKKVPSEVESIINQYPVGRYIQGSGHSGFYHIQQFVKNVEGAGKPGYILYLSDWDPAGEDIPRSVASKIEYIKHEHGLKHPVKIERMGLTEEQVREHGLPKNFEKDYPYVELNALEANMDVFVDIVRDGLESVTVSDREIKRRIKQEKDQIRSEVYRDVKARMLDREEELREVFEAVHEIAEEFEEVMDERQRAYREHVRDYNSQLGELERDDRLEKWGEIVTEIPPELDLPAASVPEIEPEDEPDDPLYDSERDYIENSRRINQLNEDED